MALLADHRLLYAIEPAAAGFARGHAAPLDAARAWFATLEIPAQPRGGHALLDALRRTARRRGRGVTRLRLEARLLTT